MLFKERQLAWRKANYGRLPPVVRKKFSEHKNWPHQMGAGGILDPPNLLTYLNLPKGSEGRASELSLWVPGTAKDNNTLFTCN